MSRSHRWSAPDLPSPSPDLPSRERTLCRIVWFGPSRHGMAGIPAAASGSGGIRNVHSKARWCRGQALYRVLVFWRRWRRDRKREGLRRRCLREWRRRLRRSFGCSTITISRYCLLKQHLLNRSQIQYQGSLQGRGRREHNPLGICLLASMTWTISLLRFRLAKESSFECHHLVGCCIVVFDASGVLDSALVNLIHHWQYDGDPDAIASASI